MFKQKTAYEMRISDWSSDVCSSDLPPGIARGRFSAQRHIILIGHGFRPDEAALEIGVDRTRRPWRPCAFLHRPGARFLGADGEEGNEAIGRASCRERVCQYV